MAQARIIPTLYTQFSHTNKFVHPLPTDDQAPWLGAVNYLPGRTANYTNYELACFMSQLRTTFARLQLAAQVVPKRVDPTGGSFLCVELYNTSGIVDAVEQTEYYQSMIDNLTTTHYIVFTAHADVEYADCILPARWMADVLPYLNIPRDVYLVGTHEYHSIDIFVLNDAIYCDLSMCNYTQVAQILSQNILIMLVKLYQQGCTKTTNPNFIVSHSLVPIESSMVLPGAPLYTITESDVVRVGTQFRGYPYRTAYLETWKLYTM
jgi:hypothetical protein